ncbi:MAG: serine/threonine protein kinase [Anaerolineaceae bacterium]|nr:serine/threonine protein kinase [Anaerolineaceae bacterium]
MSPFQPPLELNEVSSKFNRFPNIEFFDKGGQAYLYKVLFDKKSAILKIYGDSHFVRAHRECEVLEKLDSKYIVNLFDWGEVEIRGQKCIYTITEFIQGKTLKEEIRESVFNEEKTIRLGLDLISAVKELWDLDKIVHRDIKPSNIMIDTSGSAIVLDLGIARHTNRSTITEWGVSWGTSGYKSPEQARARRNLTFKSDLFAIGIVLYEVISGKHPFERRQELIGRIIPIEVREISEASFTLSKLIQLLLKENPLDRPRNFEIVYKLLKGE